MKQTVTVAAKAPTRKVSASTLGASVAVVGTYVLSQFGIVLPPEVGAASALILGTVAAYFTPYLPADE